MYCGAVKLIDIFQYSNMYAATPRISELAENEDLRRRCLQYVTKQGFVPGLDQPPQPPPFRQVFWLYSLFRSGTPIRKVLEMFESESQLQSTASLGGGCDQSNVDFRRLVTFGVVHGLIRRVHQYPISLAPRSVSLRPLAGAAGAAGGGGGDAGEFTEYTAASQSQSGDGGDGMVAGGPGGPGGPGGGREGGVGVDGSGAGGGISSESPDEQQKQQQGMKLVLWNLSRVMMPLR